MKSMILLGALLALSIGGAYCRAIDDMDNSIQPVSEYDNSDWVEMSKAPEAIVHQTDGQSIELDCEVMGSPTPTIHWIRGSSNRSPINDYKSNVISEGSSSSIIRVRSILVIDHPLQADTTYTCVGKSGGRTVYSSTTVKRSMNALRVPFESVIPRKVKIIYNYPIVLEQIGSNVVLPCKAIGRPRPEVYWMISDEIVTGQDPRIKVLPTGELLIANLKWEDMGAYKCIARNSVSNDTTETFIYPLKKE